MVEKHLLSGFYTITHKQNGSIDFGAPSGAIWSIDRHVEHEYNVQLTSQRPDEFQNDDLPAKEEKNRVYVNEVVSSADCWYIKGCAPYYVIFKRPSVSEFVVWVRGSHEPGTQVEVDVLRVAGKTTEQMCLQTFLDNAESPEEIFQQLPDKWVWHIQEADELVAHAPKTLWIGCSDARVPESVARLPDQIFVHRNIANQFHPTDNNAGSVLLYGLTGITGNPIREIRIVGHSDCGGVAACHAAANGRDGGIPPSSVLWTWLGPLRALAELYKSRPAIDLARENVRVQMRNVQETLRRLRITRRVDVKGYIYHINPAGNGRFEEVAI